MQKLTMLDYAYMAAVLLICILLFWSGDILYWQLVLEGSAVVWSFWHIHDLRQLMKTGVPTNAIVVNYSVRTHRTRHKGLLHNYTEEYQIYAPVLQYETETQVLENPYSVYRRERWFQDGEQYLIHYIPSRLELFYFPEHEDELISDYQVVMILAVIAAIITGIFGFELVFG